MKSSTTVSELDDQHFKLSHLSYQRCKEKLQLYLSEGTKLCSTLPPHHLSCITERKAKFSSLSEHLDTLCNKIQQVLQMWQQFIRSANEINLFLSKFDEKLKDIENRVVIESDHTSILHVS